MPPPRSYWVEMSGPANWAEGFIAVDWGTTNRRAYLLDGSGGCSDELEDGRGILSIAQDEFEGAVEELRDRLGCRPILLAGMVGSNRGWVEAPYVPCPAGIDEIAAELIDAADQALIVPGVSLSNGRCDVMRGEEVQILGAIESGDIPPDCLVCHPGTHNKWIRVAGGRIASFRTVMTGELFSLLKDRSILSDLLAGPTAASDAFCDGVRRSLSDGGITAHLFEARARMLLGQLERGDGASYVSGLLIGEDVRVGLAGHDASHVIIMGRPELTALYAAALETCGVSCDRVDGEGAFVAGARAIVERIS